jgi:hypothetical protein
VRPAAAARAAALLAAAVVSLASGRARAQIDLDARADEDEEELPPGQRYHSPQHFAFELRFGPYRPDIDSEFTAGRHPYQEFFGGGSRVMGQIEFDLELFHKFGTAAIGLGVGYFQVSGNSPVADGSGTLSGDISTLKIVPVSVSGVYRFDYFLQERNFPLVPYGKLGFDYAYWQITDGNGRIANDGMGGTGRGGTPGWHVGVGVALILDMFDPEAARDFDSDLGVNHTALTFEFTHADISGLGESDRLHVGDTTWSVGLLLEF